MPTRRILDIAISLPGLVILSPLAAVIAVCVRLDSEGPALYVSERSGFAGTTFRMFKFRTMPIGTPVVPTHLAAVNNVEVTRVGAILRKSSLDEIPQLINVLRGDMTLIGPRPALPSQLDLLQLRQVHDLDMVRPGITGYAQVSGRDNLSIEDKVQEELSHLTTAPLTELAVALRTLMTPFKQKDISH